MDFFLSRTKGLGAVVESRALVVACAVVALGLKVLLLLYYFDFSDDKLFQALSAKSLVEGKGIRLAMVHGSDLSAVLHRPMIAWPAGYTLVLAPFYALTGDLKWSAFLVDILSAAVFFATYVHLLRKLGFPNLVACFLLLFSGLFISQELVYSAPTDLLSASLVLLSVSYGLSLSQRARVSAVAGFVLGILCFLPSLFRYLYIPLAPIVPAVLLYWAVAEKRRDQRWAAVVALLVVFALMVVQLYILASTKGFAGNNYTTDKPTLFNVSALQQIHPFLFSAFVNLDFAAQVISSVTGASYVGVMDVFRYVHYGALLLAILLGAWLLPRLLGGEARLWERFLFLSSMAGSIIVLALCVFSLVAPPVNFWTYVQEERYYKFIALCLPLYLFRFVGSRGVRKPVLLQRIAQGIVLLLFFEILHGFYFLQKNVLPLKPLQTVSLERHEPFFASLVARHAAAGRQVVVASTNQFYYGHAPLYKANALYRCEEVNGVLFAGQPVALLVVLEDGQLPRYQNFLAKKGVRLEAVRGSFHFYSVQFSGFL